MGKEKGTIVALDAGSSHIRALVARPTLAGGVEILSAGETPSLGIQRGTVTNVDDASFAIRAALEEAGADGRLRDARVFAAVNGKHLLSKNNYGEVRVSRNDSLVTLADVTRAEEASRRFKVTEDREVVQTIARSYRVGGYVCRRNPLGMRGPTVGADSHVITADMGAAEDLRRAVQMAGKDVEALFFGGLAAAEAVLTDEEKEEGTVLIDIGGGTTEVVAFAGGAPFHSFVLPVGGNQIAGDLSIALNTPAHVAERLLLEEGTATPDGVDPTDELTIRCFGPTGTRNLRRAFLIEVVRLRVEEVLHMAFVPVLERAPQPFAGGVVLTGGVANLRGIEALAAGVLETPVRVGRPAQGSQGPTVLENPSFATAIGMVRLALTGEQERVQTPRRRFFRALPEWRFGGERGRSTAAINS